MSRESFIQLISNYDLEALSASLFALEQKLSVVDYSSDNLTNISEEYYELKELVEILSRGSIIIKELSDIDELINQAGFSDIAKEEGTKLYNELMLIEKKLIQYSTSQKKLPNDECPAIFEFRPGIGGSESSLFADQLANAYMQYFVRSKFEFEVITHEYSESGDLKLIVLILKQKNSFAKFRFEGGVIRVQRIPKTESKGRIHTSTIALTIIPEITSTIDLNISPADIRIDIYRSSGPGGQSVNTTDSAVRITHIPTGLTVSCQNGKSQHQNKEFALRILKSKLKESAEDEISAKSLEEKKKVVKDSERSSKIRTFNFPQSRVTDHRLEHSWFSIDAIMSGDLDEMITQTNEFMRNTPNTGLGLVE